MKVTCFIVLWCALAPVSVSGGDVDAGDPRSPSPDGATVAFSSIEDGDGLPATFTVKFVISGMGIAPAGVNIENTGHHHLLIDVTELPDFNQPLPESDAVRHFDKGQSDAEITLAEGSHTLQLLLADYRHVPHDPPVISESITVHVSANAPEQTNP